MYNLPQGSCVNPPVLICIIAQRLDEEKTAVVQTQTGTVSRAVFRRDLLCQYQWQ